MIRKVVILARGLGTRMQKEDQSVALDERQAQAARRGLKALIPLANGRVFLDYLLSSVADAGYSEVCLVVAPEHEELRRRYQQEMPLRRLRITFAVQEKPLGTANAVAAAEEFAGDDDFIMINSDNYYPVAALTGLRELKGAGVALFDQDTMLARSNIAAERIKAFAVGLVERDGRLVRILEKPTADVL
ncbi:MAG: NTP transferase domain-containing protein, partial [Thermogutta sp.]|uniref:sugar phosphate nucleotidyltransferase n=1 Tax=Thermogutta sp. TaxID=1962930 RepID=UPI00198DCE4D